MSTRKFIKRFAEKSNHKGSGYDQRYNIIKKKKRRSETGYSSNTSFADDVYGWPIKLSIMEIHSHGIQSESAVFVIVLFFILQLQKQLLSKMNLNLKSGLVIILLECTLHSAKAI